MNDAPPILIQARGLTKAYGRTARDMILTLLPPRLFASYAMTRLRRKGLVAVDGIDLNLRQGERLGIIGSNGAGKSTLMRLLAGISTPNLGSLAVHGHVNAILEVGLGLNPEVSGRQNVRMMGETQGLDDARLEELVRQVGEFTGMEAVLDQPVRTYSNGMTSRISFAVHLFMEPDILLIDEALSVGDAAFARKASSHIRRLCRDNRAVIIVSHHMPSIVELCNRCLWLEAGRVVMDGEPARVTAAFLEQTEAAGRWPSSPEAGTAVPTATGGGGDAPLAMELTCGAEVAVGQPLSLRLWSGLPVWNELRLLVLDAHDAPVSEYRTPRGERAWGWPGWRFDLPRWDLAPGGYVIVAQLWRGEVLAAEKRVSLHATAGSLSPPRGGQPRLWVSDTLEVRRCPEIERS